MSASLLTEISSLIYYGTFNQKYYKILTFPFKQLCTVQYIQRKFCDKTYQHYTAPSLQRNE